MAGVMEIEVSFPGGKRVDARVGAQVIRTDQPVEAGGSGEAPAPYDLFLASIATCAGIYALGFCQARGIATEGLAILQTMEVDPETHLPSVMRLSVKLPPGFPEKYRGAILKSIEGCRVKKTIVKAPRFEVALQEGGAHVQQSHVS
jgi:ribosomal protein S12 methylthiotransferase accessory factor